MPQPRNIGPGVRSGASQLVIKYVLTTHSAEDLENFHEDRVLGDLLPFVFVY